METIVTSTEAGELQHTNDIGTVSVVQVIPGQSIQVIGSDGDNADEDSESRKRRELLARRPSYRRILNELSSTDNPHAITVAKIEEESEDDGGNSSDSDDGMTTNMSGSSLGVPLQTATLLQQQGLKILPSQTLQIAAHGDASTQGLQTLTMTNVSGANVSPTGATLVQYAQAADGQFLIPVSSIGGGSIQYQLAGTTASLPQGVVMATSGGTISSTGHVPEDTSRKRELRLLKNREAARECRRKKKEYVKCLENRVAVLENQNKTLIEELKSLKELYCQKEGQS